jgi:hypothetical protein
MYRREFGLAVAATAAGLLTTPRESYADDAVDKLPYKFCAFIKFLQPLKFDDLANAIAEAGFDGVEGWSEIPNAIFGVVIELGKIIAGMLPRMCVYETSSWERSPSDGTSSYNAGARSNSAIDASRSQSNGDRTSTRAESLDH